MGATKSFVLRKLSPYFWVVVIVACFLATYAFTQRFPMPETRNSGKSDNKTPAAEASFSKTELYQADDKGNPVLEMRSGHIEMQEGKEGDDQKVQFVNIRGNFFEEGKPAMLFEGKKAFYDAKKQNVRFEGVVASSKTYGAQISGNEMLWENKKGTLEITESPVLKKDTLTMEAFTITAKPALKEVKAKGGVKTKESKEQVAIFADEQNVDFQTGEVTAKGHVKIQKENLNVQSDEAVYAQKQNLLTLTGNVVIVQQDANVTCIRAKLFLEAQKAEAEGSVKMTRKNMLVQAEKVDFSFKENTLLAQGNVQSVSTGEDKKETKLSAQTLEALVDEGKMKATGNVVFTQDNINLRGGFLSFEDKTGSLLAKDSPEIIMKDEKGNVTTLTAETVQGNLKSDAPYLTASSGVKLLRQGTSVQSDEAMFLLKDQKVTFKGTVQLVQGENKLSGEQLIFFIKENKFKITGSPAKPTIIQIVPQKKEAQDKESADKTKTP